MVGQEQQLEGGLEQGSGQAGHHRGVVASPGPPAPPGGQVHPGQEQIGGGREDSGAASGSQSCPAPADPQHQGCQGKDGGERAAQVVQQLPPCQRGQGIFLTPSPAVRHPGEQPRQQLPVPPHPAVEAGKIRSDLIGIAVRELHIPDQPGVQIGALQQVVGEHPVLGETALQAGQESVHVKNSLSCVGALVEEVVIHVAGGGAVWVYTSLSGKNA